MDCTTDAFYNGWILQLLGFIADGFYNGWILKRMYFIADGFYMWASMIDLKARVELLPVQPVHHGFKRHKLGHTQEFVFGRSVVPFRVLCVRGAQLK